MVGYDYLACPQSATISLDDCDTALAVRFGQKIGNYHCANTTTQVLHSR